MSYDPENMKKLFGDDYEKYLPSEDLGPEQGRKGAGASRLPHGNMSEQTGSLSVRPDAAGNPKKPRSYEISSSPPYVVSPVNPDAGGGAELAEAGGDMSDDPLLDTGAADFRVSFDFDREYKDVPEDRPLRQRRERRTGCVGGILFSTFVIAVSLLLASLMWIAAVDVLGFGTENEPVSVTVSDKFTLDEVTDMLYENGLIKYKLLFKLYAGFSDAEEKITSGAYILNKNFDYRAIVQGMTPRAGVRVEVTVPIPEGFTLAQIFERLEEYEVCTADKLWEAATKHDFNYPFLDKSTLGKDRLRLEGFLFPDTYNFYVGSTPQQAITKMLSEFNTRFTEEYVERAAEMEYSIHDIVTVASMIEREAGSDDERPRIAAVIYNRLNNWNNPLLQIDATIHYAIAGTSRPFSTDYDSPFNTYQHAGLPPGPIANPGMASIRAALYPNSTNEYYYALNKEGTHNFFRTLAQHEAFCASSEYGG